MDLNDTSTTILHVEDDPSLVELVQIAFRKFGFHGAMISAARVDEALYLLDTRARNSEPVNLILVDMHLPDGLGLDVIREVKSDPFWQATPVIVLSGESADGIIDDAYALGANSFFPKFRSVKTPLDSLRSLFECWLKDTILPQATSSDDRLECALARSIRLRARTADLFIRFAHARADDAGEMAFWLDRALVEGNMSNLLAFFQGRVTEKAVSRETVDRITAMQVNVKNALLMVEKRLERTPSPVSADFCRWILDFTEAVDDVAVADALAGLFQISPEAAAALKTRVTSQLQHLVRHIQDVADGEELRTQAGRMLCKGGLLAAE